MTNGEIRHMAIVESQLRRIADALEQLNKAIQIGIQPKTGTRDESEVKHEA